MINKNYNYRDYTTKEELILKIKDTLNKYFYPLTIPRLIEKKKAELCDIFEYLAKERKKITEIINQTQIDLEKENIKFKFVHRTIEKKNK